MYHTSVAGLWNVEVSILLGYDSASVGIWFSEFWDNVEVWEYKEPNTQ